MSFIFYFLGMFIILVGMVFTSHSVGIQPDIFYDIYSFTFVFGTTIFIALSSFKIGQVFRSLGLAFVDTKDKSILLIAVDCLTEMKSTSIASGFIGTIIGLIVNLLSIKIVDNLLPAFCLSLGVSLIPTLYGLIAGYLIFEPMKKNVQRQLDNLQ
jgi:flagellar motor component MotA